MNEMVLGGAVTARTIEFNHMLRFVKYVDRGARTTKMYICNLKGFFAWMRYAGTSSPVREDIISYRNWLTSAHDAIKLTAEGWAYRTDKNGNRINAACKPATIKLYLQAVKAFFRWTASEGIYPNIADNIHAPKVEKCHKKDALSAEDVVAVEDSIKASGQIKLAQAEANRKNTANLTKNAQLKNARLYAMYMLAVNAGLRCCELHRLNVKDVITKKGNTFLMVWGKGHSEADTKKPIAPAVAQAIKDYLSLRGKPSGIEPLFVSTGNRSNGKRIATTTICTMLKQALVEAGYNSERITAHSLRHTAGAAAMATTNNNIYLTQQYMRHASPATTEIYLDNDKVEEAGKLAADVYGYYHGEQKNESDTMSIIRALSPEKLSKLVMIAAAL